MLATEPARWFHHRPISGSPMAKKRNRMARKWAGDFLSQISSGSPVEIRDSLLLRPGAASKLDCEHWA
jgi:hypothetical protein